jgi:Fe-S cluster biogenesis protein NfuA
MDGGDCSFEGFEDGVVTLALQGACSSCPSATLTLKMGIEGRLKEEIPEVTEVVQV